MMMMVFDFFSLLFLVRFFPNFICFSSFHSLSTTPQKIISRNHFEFQKNSYTIQNGYYHHHHYQGYECQNRINPNQIDWVEIVGIVCLLCVCVGVWMRNSLKKIKAFRMIIMVTSFTEVNYSDLPVFSSSLLLLI